MAQQTAPQMIVPDDLFRLKFLQSAQLSPDGKTVVYAVLHVEKDKAKAGGDGKDADVEEKEYVTLWLLSLETRQARQLTAGLQVLAKANANPVVSESVQIPRIAASPQASAALTALEVASCTWPGLVDAGEHLLAVAQRAVRVNE